MGAYDLILGPVFVGTVLNVLLFGVMILQLYIYFERYKSDKTWLKVMVSFLLFLDALSAAFALEMSYNYLVTSFGDKEAIKIMNAGTIPYPFVTGLVAFAVQTFFAWRIKVLIGNKVLSYLVSILSAIQFLASIGTMIGGIHVKYFVDLEKVKSISLIWLFGSVVTDAIITVTLVCHLRQCRTGFPSTDHVLACIIRLTVQTGLLTTTCALGVVMSYLIAGTTTMHLSFGLPLSKLYTTTLMSSLNARNIWNPEGYTAEKSVSQTGVRPQSRHTRIFNTTSGVNTNGPPAVEEDSTLDHHELELRKNDIPLVNSVNKISFLV